VAVILSDEHPDEVLRALDGPGPVAVFDHRRARPDGFTQRLEQAPSRTWLVALTSGSTAAPRAVCRTRDSWQASVEALATATGVGHGSRVLVPGPLSSTLFLHAAWHADQVGATPVIEPLGTAREWDVAHLVPRQLADLLGTGAALAGRTVVVAGAAIPTAVAARAQARGVRVVAYYGAAELSFVALGEPDAESASLPPFPGVDVVTREGVLWARGPLLATGYLPDSSRDIDAGGPLQRDADGWASVGDRGRVLADGSVVVVGRGATAVQTGGVTVDVAEVEAVLASAPGVSDVVVVGVAHADLGQVVAAVVEHPDGTHDAGSARWLRSWARQRLTPHAVPRYWHLTTALPRTSAGKVDRVAARALLTMSDPPD
jgi:acyl-CoA synthetase (AMP-forming)/AMP-acid ligase II